MLKCTNFNRNFHLRLLFLAATALLAKFAKSSHQLKPYGITVVAHLDWAHMEARHAVFSG